MTVDGAAGPGAEPGSGAGRTLSWALPLALALWVAICFSPAFGAEFLNWDDDANIVDNKNFRGLSGEHLAWMFTRPHGGPYMPLTWLSLALDHAVFGLSEGFEPPEAAGFHATSVALHALAAVLFCGLARRLFVAAGADPQARTTILAAGLAGALFAVHPLRAESVAWVTERRDVLSAIFFVLAVSTHLRAVPARSSARLAPGPAALALAAGAAALALFFGSVELGPERLSFGVLGAPGLTGAVLALGLCAAAAPRAAPAEPGSALPQRGPLFALSVFWLLLAFLSKALGVTLPLVLLCLDLWPLRRWRRGDGLGPAAALWIEKAPFFVLALVFGLLAFWGQGRYPEALVSLEDHPFPQRLAQAVYGLWWYPTRTLVPVGLVPLVELPAHDWIRSARFLVPAVGLAITVVAAVWLRRRAPALLLGLATFALLIAPVLGLTQAGAQLVADRYSYLACMPFALLLAGGWLVLCTRRADGRAGAQALPALAAVLALGALTYRQTSHWHDTETLWTYNLSAVPEAVRPHYMLGRMHYRNGQGDGGAADELERARVEFRRGLGKDSRVQPYYHSVYGALLIDLGDFAGAVRILQGVTSMRPEDPIALTNLGVALRSLKRTREALEVSERAVRADPDYTKGWIQLALTREVLGDRGGAAQAWAQVIEDWPRYGPAQKKLKELAP